MSRDMDDKSSGRFSSRAFVVSALGGGSPGEGFTPDWWLVVFGGVQVVFGQDFSGVSI